MTFPSLTALRRSRASSVYPAFSRTRKEAWFHSYGTAKTRVRPCVSMACRVTARSAPVVIPRPQKSSPSQYPISADTRSTSCPKVKPTPPTACPPTAMANRVSGFWVRADRMNSLASSIVKGWGNASRRFSQILALFAWTARLSASDSSHVRTSARAVWIRMVTAQRKLDRSLRGGRIDHRADARDPVRRETALLRVLANRLLVGRHVHAIDLVVRHVTVDPLDLRTHLPQHPARLLRNPLQLLGCQVAGPRNLTLDHVLGHRVPPFFEEIKAPCHDGVPTTIASARAITAPFPLSTAGVRRVPH